MERSYWKALVGAEALPFDSFARATSGQLTLYYLHVILDAEERERRVHLACLPKLSETLCEVCHKPVNLLDDYADQFANKKLSPREYMEHQANMPPEEKEARERFFKEFFLSKGVPEGDLVNTKQVEDGNAQTD